MEEDDDMLPGYSIELLEEKVSCSAAELLAGLKECGAFEFVPGRWAVLTPASEFEILEDIVVSMMAEGMKHEAIDLQRLIKATSSPYLKSAVSHCFNSYFKKITSPPVPGATHAFLPAKYCVLLARKLLLQKPAWNKQVMLKAWRSLAREEFEPALSMLNGLAIVIGDEIKWYPEYRLPMDPQERFGQLFQQKAKWSRAELLPYISKLPISVEDLLLQWALLSKNADGEEVITERAL
eukprot:TRINITY_DN12905_c0_g1_i1.p1 TRINITY_DN12905_c0_g1~~TRINITY_DN12905_c0_g1_i1.p1  ORF type:complete len:237 (-),score=49.68 TRINITY_DN12905_c0_g1_i1:105-815(-)